MVERNEEEDSHGWVRQIIQFARWSAADWMEFPSFPSFPDFYLL